MTHLEEKMKNTVGSLEVGLKSPCMGGMGYEVLELGRKGPLGLKMAGLVEAGRN